MSITLLLNISSKGSYLWYFMQWFSTKPRLKPSTHLQYEAFENILLQCCMETFNYKNKVQVWLAHLSLSSQASFLVERANFLLFFNLLLSEYNL